MLRVKGSDTLCPLGPGLVTDWDFHGKRLRTYVNGELVQDGSTDEMAWDMHYLVADIARHDHAVPGRRAAVRHAGQLAAGPARRRGRGRGRGPRPAASTTSSPGRCRCRADVGAQPTETEEVVSTALGGDWEFRGIRPPRRPEGDTAMPAPRMCLILSENWTMTCGRDLPRLVRWAREAEDAGFDSVMISEHIVLGPAAGAHGIMANPREYALPGNQDPATPWPSSVVLLSAIAAVTTRIRLVASAVIAPLRHPLLIARELGSLDLLSGGRLVVQPTVSWLEEEYAALGVPFRKRGDLLDEHLAAWRVLWRDTPASFRGRALLLRRRLLRAEGVPAGGPAAVARRGQPAPADAGARRQLRQRLQPARPPGARPSWLPWTRRCARRAGIRAAWSWSAAPARSSPAPDSVRRSRPGPGHDPAAGRSRVHHVLHQAVAVHRRPGRRRAAVPGDHPPGGRDAAGRP